MLHKSFHQLAGKVARYGGACDYTLLNLLTKPTSDPKAWYVARLRALRKTRKRTPTWRNLHCASGSATLGLSRWLGSRFEAILSRYPLILPTALSFKRAASGKDIANDEAVLFLFFSAADESRNGKCPSDRQW